MSDGIIRFIPNDPVDQETADALQAMVNFVLEQMIRDEIDHLMFGGPVSSGQAKILQFRRRPDASPDNH